MCYIKVACQTKLHPMSSSIFVIIALMIRNSRWFNIWQVGEIDTLFRKTYKAEEMQATPNRAQIIKPTFSTWDTESPEQ